jgi:hypothetical protein
MTLSELLEELRLSRTRTQNGWVVHSHKPGTFWYDSTKIKAQFVFCL